MVAMKLKTECRIIGKKIVAVLNLVIPSNKPLVNIVPMLYKSYWACNAVQPMEEITTAPIGPTTELRIPAKSGVDAMPICAAEQVETTIYRPLYSAKLRSIWG
jgi:hypothetical protein